MAADPVIDHPALVWYRDRPREGYALVTAEPSAPIVGQDSRIGGFPFLPADQSWPVCTKCGVALFFVGQFGRDLPPMPLPDGVELPCIYKCSNMDCDNWWGDYRGPEFFHLYGPPLPSAPQSPGPDWDGKGVFPPPGIAFGRHSPENNSICVEVGFPFSVSLGERFTDFPGWEENDSWRQIDDPAFYQYLELYPRAGAKLLGHPKWEQGPSYPRCQCCKSMRHMIQLELPHVRLGDGGRMHVFHCADWCSGPESLAVVWQCG